MTMGGAVSEESEIIEEHPSEADLREIRALVEYAKRMGWIRHRS